MEIICIVCPNGCRLTVESTAGGMIVKGNKCPKGVEYGRQEAGDPMRVVTAVVRTRSPEWPCVPVKTSRPVPKKVIALLLKTLYGFQVELPVRRGEPLIKDFQGTGVQVVFTRTVPPKHGAGWAVSENRA